MTRRLIERVRAPAAAPARGPPELAELTDARARGARAHRPRALERARSRQGSFVSEATVKTHVNRVFAEARPARPRPGGRARLRERARPAGLTGREEAPRRPAGRARARREPRAGAGARARGARHGHAKPGEQVDEDAPLEVDAAAAVRLARPGTSWRTRSTPSARRRRARLPRRRRLDRRLHRRAAAARRARAWSRSTSATASCTRSCAATRG